MVHCSSQEFGADHANSTAEVDVAGATRGNEKDEVEISHVEK
jgi:hypothetical protein